MFAKESGTKVESMYAWIDEACIDQGTWAKYPDIGMAFVYGTFDSQAFYLLPPLPKLRGTPAM